MHQQHHFQKGTCMNNITSYIRWRGDLTLTERPFCEIDNLVLSELAYMPMNGFVPKQGEEGSITVEAAMKRMLVTEESQMDSRKADFARALMESRRFGALLLRNHVDLANLEGTETDFSAVEILLPEDTVYVAFRGTNDALVGWREDFSMCFQIMPAQRHAVQYMQDIENEDTAHYYIGGHSKGGNLALYAAANCSEEQQEKILKIYSNDGPGLCREIIPEEQENRVREKLLRIVPEYSMIGELFRTEAETLIVKSSGSGIMQHDALTWQVEGDRFVTCASLSSEAQFYNNILDTWIESADMEHRESFTNTLFTSLEANGAKKLSDMSESGADDFLAILVSLTQGDGKTRNVIFRFGQVFFSAIRHADIQKLVKSRDTLQAAILIVVGFIVSWYPSQAASLIGIIIGSAGALYLGKRILDTAFTSKGTIEARKTKVVIQLGGMCILMYLIADRDFLLQITNLLLGITFLLFAYRWMTRAFTYPKIFPKRIIGLAISAVSFCAGMLPIIMSGVEMTAYMRGVGGLCFFYGIALLIYQAYKNGKETAKQKQLGI